MDLRKLKTLIDLVSESNISELEITEAEGKVRIVKSEGAPGGALYSAQSGRSGSGLHNFDSLGGNTHPNDAHSEGSKGVHPHEGAAQGGARSAGTGAGTGTGSSAGGGESSNSEVNAASAPNQPTGHVAKSPMVGTFYRSSTPGGKPFIDVGSVVKEGDTICIIEAMKILNEIEADHSGTVTQILIKDGQAVEYGQSLFVIE